MAAAIYRDATGRYKGIDLIGENREIFDLRPEQHITDEDTAIAAAREIHGKLLAGLDEIKSCLSAGRIEQFSFVELHFDGTYHSFWIPGYPSKEEIERSEPYLEMRTECPDAKCIVIEVVSRLIYQEAAPASNALMYVLTNLGFERANRLGNVFIGQSDRYEEIRN
jgi:hypothetical protein